MDQVNESREAGKTYEGGDAADQASNPVQTSWSCHLLILELRTDGEILESQKVNVGIVCIVALHRSQSETRCDGTSGSRSQSKADLEEAAAGRLPLHKRNSRLIKERPVSPPKTVFPVR